MIIQVKRLEVIIYIWRRKQDKDTGKYEDVKGFRALKGVSISHIFIKPDYKLRLGLLTRHVNAFHLSHTVNYNPGLHEIGLCTSTRWSPGTWQLLLMFH